MNHFIHPTLRMLLDYFQEKEQVMCNTLLFFRYRPQHCISMIHLHNLSQDNVLEITGVHLNLK